MQKWEYQMIEGLVSVDVLNAWGAQGWELIAADDFTGSGRVYIFKRPKF
jgi:hypothetical protein